MRRSVTILCLVGMATIGAGFAQTATAQDNARTVEFELREGGELVASPTVRMQVGRPAAISAGSYSLRLRMERGAAEGDAPAPYVIRSSLYRSDSGWTLVASPAVTVVAGEQARMRFAGSDGSDLSLAVLVR